jgi:hypothetical protein
MAGEKSGADTTMIKSVTTLVIALSILPAGIGSAQDKAPCGSFKKGTDNTWQVVSPVKIETDKGSGMLSPGTTIRPGKLVAGVDIYAQLQRSCPGQN